MTEATVTMPHESAGVEEAERLHRHLRRYSLACILVFVLAMLLSSMSDVLAAQANGAVVAAVLPFLCGLVYLVLFIVTMSTARHFGEAIGLRDYRWSVRWTVISCVIPILNIVRPWLGFGETYRSLINAARTRRLDATWNHGFSVLTFLMAALVAINMILSRSSEFDSRIHPLPVLLQIVLIAIGLLSLALPIVYLVRVRRAARRLLSLYLERSAVSPNPLPA